MICLDTSAVVKLARRGAETDALRAWLGAHPAPLAVSSLVRTEGPRALRRSEPAGLPALRAVLALCHQVPVTDDVLDAAADLPGRDLRSLEAIQLATAELLRPVLTAFLVYDKRLADAAAGRGLPVESPA